MIAAMLGGCGVQSACQESVRQKLLNPETAEFFEFEREAGTDLVLEAKGGFQLYNMRVKAEGALGNKITQIAYCYVPNDPPSSDQKCTCYFR